MVCVDRWLWQVFTMEGDTTEVSITADMPDTTVVLAMVTVREGAVPLVCPPASSVA